VNYAALIPVKTLSQVKSRLADHFTATQRAQMVLDMLHHVLCVLQNSHAFSHVAVVSEDKTVLQYAERWGALGVVEEQAGHNPALTAAARREIQMGTDALLTISADLPLLQTDEICGILEQAHYHDVILSPSQDGTGTNALLTRPPLVIPYLFGVHSFQHYQQEGKRRGLDMGIYNSIGLALDVDTIEDIEILQDVEMQQYRRSDADLLVSSCY
jgi:2-phospho-L-lactate/phosphoenolpyruvate guanylyltransferase